MTRVDDLLRDKLSREDYKLFEKYLNADAVVLDLERKKTFAYGYKLAVKLLEKDER